MERQEIYNRLRGIILANMYDEEEEVTEQSIMSSDLGLDSIDAVEIAIAIDREFGIDTNIEDIEARWSDMTVGQLVDIVQSKKKKS